MLANLILEVPGEPLPTPTLQDDLQSFVHVLTWVSLHYISHSWGSNHLTAHIRACLTCITSMPKAISMEGTVHQEIGETLIYLGRVDNKEAQH